MARRRPFEGDTTRLLLQRIESGEHEPLRRIASSIPRDLETICHKALEVDAERRYPTAGAFAEDLRRFLRIEPILAKPPGSIVRAVKWLRRHRVRVALWSAAAVLAVGAPLGVALHEADAAASLERERRALDAAEALSFESIEQTLTMVDEQLQSLPAVNDRQHQRVDRVVGLCERFLRLRAEEPSRRVRVASALYVISYIYARLGRIEAAATACDRGVQLIASSLDGIRASRPESLQGVMRLHAQLLRRRLYIRQLTEDPGSDEDFERAIASWRELVSSPAGELPDVLGLAETLLVRARALADTRRGRLEGERLARQAIAVLTPVRNSLDERVAILKHSADTLLGVVLLSTGRVEEAVAVLEPTVAQLEAIGDDVVLGVRASAGAGGARRSSTTARQARRVGGVVAAGDRRR